MTAMVSSKLTAAIWFIFSRKEARGMVYKVQGSRRKAKGERRKSLLFNTVPFRLIFTPFS
jgi:hypothetical protein